MIRNATQHQAGVFRTNCKDCLDRTNVVQCQFARRALEDSLVRMGVLSEEDRGAAFATPSFNRIFTNMWADNADEMSMQYAGSGALKTGFTRTGKRTYSGVIQDARNSLTRFYVNNFQDGYNQDAIDIFLCNYRPTKTNPISPFSSKPSSASASVPASSSSASIVSLAIKVMSLVFLFFSLFNAVVEPESMFADIPHSNQCMLAVCVGAVSFLKLLLQGGRQYVNKPRLLVHEHQE